MSSLSIKESFSLNPRNNYRALEEGGDLQFQEPQPEKVQAKPFKCEYTNCKYQSSRLDQLKIHCRHHTGQYFICDYPDCDYKSLTSGNLKSHKRRHTGNYFFCSYLDCNYKSTTAGNLKVHLYRHNGVKSFVCPHDGCIYQATTNGNLKRHMKRHTGEKPFKCPFKNCNHQATRADNLKVHIKIHTNQITDINTGEEEIESSSMHPTTSNLITTTAATPTATTTSSDKDNLPTLTSQHATQLNLVNGDRTSTHTTSMAQQMGAGSSSMYPTHSPFNSNNYHPYTNNMMIYPFNKGYPGYMYPPQLPMHQMHTPSPFYNFPGLNPPPMYSYNVIQQNQTGASLLHQRSGLVQPLRSSSILSMTRSTLPGACTAFTFPNPPIVGETTSHCDSSTSSGSASSDRSTSSASSTSSGDDNSSDTSYHFIDNGRIKATSHSKKSLSCPFAKCEYNATTNANLKRHMRRHTGERPFECKVEGCVYRSAQAGNLKSHLKNRHPGEFQAIYASKNYPPSSQSVGPEADAAFMLMSMFSSSSVASSSLVSSTSGCDSSNSSSGSTDSCSSSSSCGSGENITECDNLPYTAAVGLE